MRNQTPSYSFLFGRFVITANAFKRLRLLDVYFALCRHAAGAFGPLPPPTLDQQRYSFKEYLWHQSGWRDRRGTEFYIVTEGDLSRTRVLLPEDLK